MRPHSPGVRHFVTFCCRIAILSVSVTADCWILEGDNDVTLRAICSQNMPPYEEVPRTINGSILDLRLNHNHIKKIKQEEIMRFSNLSYLDLSHNHIEFIEEGAFSTQDSLRVLRLGTNRLAMIGNLTFSGLFSLEYLYLQSNHLRRISASALRDSPNLHTLDLSDNKLRNLNPKTIQHLSHLEWLQLSANPLHCSCDMLPLLRWMGSFRGAGVPSLDLLQCQTPEDLMGQFLLRPQKGFPRTTREELSESCKGYTPPVTPESSFTTSTDEGESAETPAERCETCMLDVDDVPPLIREVLHGEQGGITQPPNTRPSLELLQSSLGSATIRVRIPRPFDRMYALASYNNSGEHVLQNLHDRSEDVTMHGIPPRGTHMVCVVSIRNGPNTNHTCLQLSTIEGENKLGDSAQLGLTSSSTYRAAALFGSAGALALAFAAAFCFIRRKHDLGRQQSDGGQRVKSPSSVAGVPRAGIMERGSPQESKSPRFGSRSPQSGSLSKSEYMEVRADEEHMELRPPGEDSVEISTIAREVDRVNLIINSCIDVLKSDANDPVSSLLDQQQNLQEARLEAPVRSERTARSLPALDKAMYIPLGSCNHGAQGGCTSTDYGVASPVVVQAHRGAERNPVPIILTHPILLPLHPEPLDIPPARHCFSCPGPASGAIEAPRGSPSSDLTAGRMAVPAGRGYASSPEAAGSRGTMSLLRKLRRPLRRTVVHVPTEDEPLAAGNALKRKVRLAQHEDLHDILDYWKGVGAQRRF
uniref:protein ELFN1-like n=1 Tax=Myxine glutinosa TaxID=7769 RepID=UPI00358E2090